VDIPFELETRTWNREAVIRDYRLGIRSRHTSVIARGEVFSGKAKFGIFGDGKEAAQMAMAYAFQYGDFRSGYYRDQTFMFALGLLEPRQFFAQLFAHADAEAEPCSGGRQMTSHFATRLLDADGNVVAHVDRYNSAADLSPTGSQMPRLVGLAYASKLYREIPALSETGRRFSDRGNEIAFGTIGNAGCAEGMFWESVNAVGVLQVPMLLSIWDDGFGISVPNAFQMTKGDISRILEGFQHRHGGRPGLDIQVARGWNYPELCETYIEAAIHVRRDHTPAIIHVTELTQPLGHSTSGNHERYKAPERLEWEKEHDCLVQFRAWILDRGLADAATLDAIDREEKQSVLEAREEAWKAFREPIDRSRREVVRMIADLETAGADAGAVSRARQRLESKPEPLRRDLMAAVTEALMATRGEDAAGPLRDWRQSTDRENVRRYGSHLYSESSESALRIPIVAPRYAEDPPIMKGFEILNLCLDRAFGRIPELIAIGEDVGLLGGVNQGWAHMQEKYGVERVTDTGIREATIVGQAIGMAMRGLRPIAEIQYLDYLLYALQIISDDLATLRWRTAGGQKAPVIIRTRGHRLEGIWHSGSPMSGIINLVRGIYVCVPRNSVQAAGFYNTMLQSDDAALIVEVLNAYRLKEAVPDNLDELTIPLGVPEVLREGDDVTIVTYGACCSIALNAAALLEEAGIGAEVIDVRTLLPFDTHKMIVGSLEKTNRVLFLDEDCPGGATAYMMQDVLERQGGYQWLDAAPRTLAARPHRPAYGSDGDYFSKPSREDAVHTVYSMMRESDPARYPRLL
jgi:pyruvate/2-oxoglutarate/acetoin dehydrogenase E1 component/TPP-dependent pyruvate/acetoin dehydrogenase alpha subunit